MIASLLIIFCGLWNQALTEKRELNVEQTDKDYIFHNDLDGYPITDVKFNFTRDSSFCTFGESEFLINRVFDVTIFDDSQAELNYSMFNNMTQIFNSGNNISLVHLINVTSNEQVMISTQSRNVSGSADNIYKYTACRWTNFGENAPIPGDKIRVIRAEPVDDVAAFEVTLLMSVYNSELDGRNYLLVFKVRGMDGCIIEGSVQKYDDFFFDSKRFYYVNGLLGYKYKQFLYFSQLQDGGEIVVKYKYDLSTMNINMTDFQLLADPDYSFILIDNRFNTGSLLLSKAPSFSPPTIKVLFNCQNGRQMGFIPTFNCSTIIQCINPNMTIDGAYYMSGSTFDSYRNIQIPGVNFTSPIQTAEQSRKLTFMTSHDKDIVFGFKNTSISGFYNYSNFQMIMRNYGFMFVNSSSTDLNNSMQFLGYVDPETEEVAALQIEKFDFKSTEVYQGYKFNCSLSTTSTKTIYFNVTTLLQNTYEIFLTYVKKENTESTAFIKTVMIGVTIILTIILIMGSFWLMSRRNKEEDIVLEEFKLDYIKYSNKRSQNDSSSLINHEIH